MPLFQPMIGSLTSRIATWFGREPKAAEDVALAVPFGGIDGLSPAPRMTVVIHAFFPEVFAEILDAVSSIPGRPDLLITTDHADKGTALKDELNRQGLTGHVVLVENRGRDIWPKLVALRELEPETDLVLFLHTKRSDHDPALAGWRRALLDSLCGNPQVSRSVLALFAARPDIGLIAPRHHPGVRRFIDWGSNFQKARSFAARLGVSITRWNRIDFPSGSMFWARPAALQPLLDLNLSVDDFAKEAGQTDGTTAHAIERIFFISAEIAGFRWIKVGGGELAKGEGLITVNDASELAGVPTCPPLLKH